jgi:hypothetical protein
MISITIIVKNENDMPEDFDEEIAELLASMGLKGTIDNGRTMVSTDFGEEVSPMQGDIWLKDL